jgi:release factor glutamine methyltransferase
LTGSAVFCGVVVFIDAGVYVPRPQSEALAREASVRLPPDGVAVDLCTGSGAIAVVLKHRRPRARVIGTEIDLVAATCARRNGVHVVVGDMADDLSSDLDGQVDVVTAVVPYVPTHHLRLLPRDVLAFEPRGALDGGELGTDYLARAVAASARLLRPEGTLLLEMGGDQDGTMVPQLAASGFCDIERHVDDDGELRALYCRRQVPRPHG